MNFNPVPPVARADQAVAGKPRAREHVARVMPVAAGSIGFFFRVRDGGIWWWWW